MFTNALVATDLSAASESALPRRLVRGTGQPTVADRALTTRRAERVSHCGEATEAS